MKRIFFTSAVVLLLAACGKDKFETKPRFVLKSQSASFVPIGNNLRLVFEYTDKEGDVNDTLYFKKERLNLRKVATVRDSLPLIVPDFPHTPKGEIVLNLDYQTYLISAQEAPRANPGQLPEKFESDTLNLKFVLKDKAGNKSDTVRVDNVIIERTS